MGAAKIQFDNLVAAKGSPTIYHRDESIQPCPCRTWEGFRDPEWHEAHPNAIVCNENGFLPGATVHLTVKAFVQPVETGRARFQAEVVVMSFGQVETDDHIGIFPISWGGIRLNFYDWGKATEDYVEYHGMRFTVVNVNLIPDPSDGDPEHHYEIALRRIPEV
jgi:hypothetical protein